MRRVASVLLQRGCGVILIAGLMPAGVFAQAAFTWQQIKDKFEAANPTLKAAQASIDESRAAEITAYLRPNPNFTLTADGVQVSRNLGVWRPFSGVVETPSFSYLHERQHKRELRSDAAKQFRTIVVSSYSDQERSLLFSLRKAFIQVLKAKAVLQNAKENLDYWDCELGGRVGGINKEYRSNVSFQRPGDGCVEGLPLQRPSELGDDDFCS